MYMHYFCNKEKINQKIPLIPKIDIKIDTFHTLGILYFTFQEKY